MARKRIQKGLMPKTVAAAQRDVEKTARRAWGQTVSLLPPSTRKAVQRFTHGLERRGTQVQRRFERARADVEARGEELVSAVTHRAERALMPIVHRLDVASRADVDRLRKRLAALERRVPTPEGPPASV